MTPENFCYWLRGFTELRDNTVPPTQEQWLEIQRHLMLVMERKDPGSLTKATPSPATPNLWTPPPTRRYDGGMDHHRHFDNSKVGKLIC